MKALLPLHGGNSVIHFPRVAKSGLAMRRPADPTKPIWASIGAAFEAVMGWLERRAANARYRELDAYLAQSSDLCDLERRIRRVERSYGGKFDSNF